MPKLMTADGISEPIGFVQILFDTKWVNENLCIKLILILCHYTHICYNLFKYIPEIEAKKLSSENKELALIIENMTNEALKEELLQHQRNGFFFANIHSICK